MSDNSPNHSRIAKNTVLLYMRMLFIMLVQLYASRVVLNTLGVVDYGIYNVVGGVVALFAFLDWAMVTSTQRYITYELGRGESNRLTLVFSTSIQIYAVISFIIIVLSETVGLWFFYHKMVIPPDRMHAAMWVFQLSIVTMVVSIMSYPYTAAIIAHEEMGIFAAISIIEAVLKLLIVFMLNIGTIDKLILYAILTAAAKLFIRVLYTGYCRKTYPSLRLIFHIDKPLMKEMASFAGWNLFGEFAAVTAGTGINLLLNVFFGPAVNAARAVAVQVQSAIDRFVSGFQTAINPQITKQYAQGQKDEMAGLIFKSTKFAFFLMLVIMLPVALEAEPILTLWLKNVPENSVIFMRLVLCFSLLGAFANPIKTSAIATGDIKKYQLVSSCILLPALPLSWAVLEFGMPPAAVYAVLLILQVVKVVAQLLITKQLIDLNLSQYVKKVIVPCVVVGVLSFGISFTAYKTLGDQLWMFLVVCIISALSTALVAFCFGFTQSERNWLWQRVQKIVRKKEIS